MRRKRIKAESYASSEKEGKMNRQVVRVQNWALLALMGLAAAGLMGIAGAQQSTTLTVCPSGPPACQYTSVQEALKAANSGDRIEIAPGTYAQAESITITKGVTLAGTGQKPEEVVLQGNKQVPVIVIKETEKVTIENLTVREGSGGEVQTPFVGGGIQIEASNGIILRNLLLTENITNALFAKDSQEVRIENSQFLRTVQRITTGRERDGNGVALLRTTVTVEGGAAADNQGFGIGIAGSRVQVTGTMVRSNRLGGISAVRDSETGERSAVTLENVTVEENVRRGVIGDASSLEVKNSRVLKTQAEGQPGQDNGDGVAVYHSATLNIVGSTTEGNAAAGIVVATSKGQISGTTVRNNGPSPGVVVVESEATLKGNQIEGNRGYGVCLSTNGQATLEKNRILRNASGGICMSGRFNATLRENEISANNFGVVIGFRRVANEAIQAEFVQNTMSDHQQCALFIDSDPGIRILGSGNRFSNNVRNICGATEKIPPGF